MSSNMTKGERQELQVLIRKREKVLKSKAKERSAEMLAQFEDQISALYHWDDDDVWRKAFERAEAAAREAQVEVEARCKDLGIPAEFAPALAVGWSPRGRNAVAERRSELRTAAKARIEACERQALSQIEMLSLEAQTEVVSSGLESEAAKQFLKDMTPIEAQMKALEMDDIEKLADQRRSQRRSGYIH